MLAAVAPSYGTVSVFDRARARGFFWTHDPASLADWEHGSPLRNLLRWALADHGVHLLHGAAIGVPGGGGVLLLGVGGAGKSTTALTCLAAGFDVVADDYVLVDAEPRAHRLYSIAKLGAGSLALVPGLAPFAGPLAGRSTRRTSRSAIATRRRSRCAPSSRHTSPAHRRARPDRPGRRLQAHRRVLHAAAPRPARDDGDGTRRAAAPPPGPRPAGRTGRRGGRRPDRSAVPGVNDLSVIMPLFDGAPWVGDAIASVLEGADGLLELLVIDDGSTDDGAAVARRHGPPVRVIAQANAGPAAARNRGLDEARGDVIAFLDADDLWLAGRPDPRRSALATADVVAGSTRTFVDGAPEPYAPDEPTLALGSLLVRRAVVDRVGRFDPVLRRGEDVDWRLRLREAGIEAVLVPDVVLGYRLRPGSLTRDVAATHDGMVAAVAASLRRRGRLGAGG